MTGLRLNIETERWQRHLRAQMQRPGLVPVMKGNGYGFGVANLAGEAGRLGASTVAVGSAQEAKVALREFDGDVVVMMPYFAADPVAREVAEDPRVIVTVAHLGELAALSGVRVLVEVRTSMQRHGISVLELPKVADHLQNVTFEGWTVHLPMLAGGSNFAEAEELGRSARQIAEGPLWFSHVSDDDHKRLVDRCGPDVRLRRGTELWLGDRGALSVTATILDVHKVVKGQPVGYHRRGAPRNGWAVVVSGGTAHGIGLEAPATNRNLRDRAKSLALGAMDAVGWALSPYEIDGRKRYFLEPPHMQSSMLFLPADARPPKIGDEIPVTVRNTIATFDE